MFDADLSPKRIITNLELFFGEPIQAENTLIIFDEIQAIPRALTSLKYFNEDAPQYHIAASGSLLGVAIHLGTSFPVGKVDFLHLEPMDFEEFLIANGQKRFVKAYKENVDKMFDNVLYNSFNHYLTVGGMPEAVESWTKEKDIAQVKKIHTNILNAYLFDFSKHAGPGTSRRINQIWDSIPRQFAKENKKFVWGMVKEGARAREYEIALQWLIDSSVARKVNRVECGDKIPLAAYKDPNAFKLYFVDVGLLRSLSKIPSSVVLEKNAIFSEFNGLLAEQFVAQNLSEFAKYYWTSNAQAEVDFVSQIDTKIIPVEVKSGLNVKARSLKVYREKYNPALSARFSLLPLEYNSGLMNIPLYYSFLFEELINRQEAVV